jgi:hypothetical protein
MSLPAQPSPPVHLEVDSVGYTAVIVSWERPAATDTAVHYCVYLNDTLKKQLRDTEAYIFGLTPGTTCSISVSAVDSFLQESDRTPSVLFTTLADTLRPTIPRNLTVTSVGANFAAFSWDSSTDDAGVGYYELVVYDTQADSIVNSFVTFSSRATIHMLHPARGYHARVCACDINNKTSDSSSVVTCTTQTAHANIVVMIDRPLNTFDPVGMQLDSLLYDTLSSHGYNVTPCYHVTPVTGLDGKCYVMSLSGVSPRATTIVYIAEESGVFRGRNPNFMHQEIHCEVPVSLKTLWWRCMISPDAG